MRQEKPQGLGHVAGKRSVFYAQITTELALAGNPVETAANPVLALVRLVHPDHAVVFLVWEAEARAAPASVLWGLVQTCSLFRKGRPRLPH